MIFNTFIAKKLKYACALLTIAHAPLAHTASDSYSHNYQTQSSYASSADTVLYGILAPICTVAVCFSAGWLIASALEALSAEANYQAADIPKITFNDVIGAEDAKAALTDVVQSLKSPETYTRLGAHIPKGVLLEGSPGNGKTLLAKALAGEAGVPFISINGAEFSARYYGIGIQRVKALFRKARRMAPCIVFIDEIDGIGKRSSDDQPAAKEDNRIIAELLTQMDGLTTDPKKPMIIVGATNHRGNIDEALLRSGRFDTIVKVENPEAPARKEILELYAKKITADATVDFVTLAQKTVNFSGADLANATNQAALIAARRKADAVTQSDFEQALAQMIQTRKTPVQKQPVFNLNDFLNSLATQTEPAVN